MLARIAIAYSSSWIRLAKVIYDQVHWGLLLIFEALISFLDEREAAEKWIETALFLAWFDSLQIKENCHVSNDPED